MIQLPVSPDKKEMVIHKGALSESQIDHLRNITARIGFQYFCDHFDQPRQRGRSVEVYYYQNSRLHREIVSPYGRILSSKVLNTSSQGAT